MKKKVNAFLTEALDGLKTLGGILLVLSIIVAIMSIGYLLALLF